jgi:hypothetical protein
LGDFPIGGTQLLQQPAGPLSALAIRQSQAGGQPVNPPEVEATGAASLQAWGLRKGRFWALSRVWRGQPARFENLQLDRPDAQSITVDQFGIGEGPAVESGVG